MMDMKRLNMIRQQMQMQQQMQQVQDQEMQMQQTDQFQQLRQRRLMAGQAAMNPSQQPPQSMLAQAMQGGMRGGIPNQNPGAPSDKMAMRGNSY